VLTIPARVIAACFALVGFAAAIAVGLAAHNSAITVIWKAIVVMMACYVVGRVIGAVAQRAVQQDIDRFKQAHPFPNGAAARTDRGADGANGASEAEGAAR